MENNKEQVLNTAKRIIAEEEEEIEKADRLFSYPAMRREIFKGVSCF
ncbi:MAG: hypothetical protein M1407_00570 [Deltaproteobacteria bacterium]|nr:hypothetical protein [Deltaproteobacteria bacterium]